jgi:hypothetical protein
VNRATSLTGTCDACGAEPAYPYDGGTQFFCPYHTQRTALVGAAEEHLRSLLYNTLSVFSAAYEGSPVMEQLGCMVGQIAQAVSDELRSEVEA